MTATIKLARLEKNLDDAVEQGQRILAKWAENFAQDPVYALNWSNNTFEVAADVDIAQKALMQIADSKAKGANADQVVKELRNLLTAKVLTDAQYVPSSDNVTSNLMDAEKIAAAACLLEKLTWLL